MAAQVLKFDGLVFESQNVPTEPVYFGGLKFEQETQVFEQFVFTGFVLEILQENLDNAIFCFGGI